jgi:ATP/ADP translocase
MKVTQADSWIPRSWWRSVADTKNMCFHYVVLLLQGWKFSHFYTIASLFELLV